jgi:hypothetical protein
MTTKNLHILGIDPGGTTGWCLLTVARAAIFADEESGILEWDYGELTGPEPGQAIAIMRMCLEIQGLDYKTGVAIMAEQWDIDPNFKSTDQESYSPVRINAQLQLLHYEKRMGDATLHFQSRALAFGTATDERLKHWGLWVEGSTHIRAAARHAIVGLRRAKENWDFALELWPYPSTGMP